MGSNRTSNARVLRALIWAQRALKSTLKRAYERSRALATSSHERSCQKQGCHERSLFAVFWSTTSAEIRALMSARAVCARERSWADILAHERSWALVVPIARERSSAHFDFALWIRIWALPFKFNQYMTNPKMLHQQNKKGNYQIAVPALIWRLQ